MSFWYEPTKLDKQFNFKVVILTQSTIFHQQYWFLFASLFPFVCLFSEFSPSLHITNDCRALVVTIQLTIGKTVLTYSMLRNIITNFLPFSSYCCATEMIKSNFTPKIEFLMGLYRSEWRTTNSLERLLLCECLFWARFIFSRWVLNGNLITKLWSWNWLPVRQLINLPSASASCRKG